MRILLAFILFPTLLSPVFGQLVCISDSIPVYQMPGTDLPPLRGAAVFDLKDFKIVVGGKFIDPTLPDSLGVYNCDMLIVDYKAGKKYVLPLGYFPPGVADQFSGVDYCFTMENDTAYILGGYGYDLAEGYETTFPYMTFFPINALIDSVLQGKDFYDLFHVVYDPNLSVAEGNMIRIGVYFLVYNGREVTPIKDEHTDRLFSNEWDFRGQLRKFRLKNDGGYLTIDEFQICYNAETFYQCMPAKWKI
jgi:hypothetical protein